MAQKASYGPDEASWDIDLVEREQKLGMGRGGGFFLNSDCQKRDVRVRHPRHVLLASGTDSPTGCLQVGLVTFEIGDGGTTADRGCEVKAELPVPSRQKGHRYRIGPGQQERKGKKKKKKGEKGGGSKDRDHATLPREIRRRRWTRRLRNTPRPSLTNGKSHTVNNTRPSPL
ncbi:hypothetical protein LZ30DRAFT_725628 [Colletotrichum cereale]|nr:hypothetical protein LZ30DRAFT_725628 [Colletotrichum cereale]